MAKSWSESLLKREGMMSKRKSKEGRLQMGEAIELCPLLPFRKVLGVENYQEGLFRALYQSLQMA